MVPDTALLQASGSDAIVPAQRVFRVFISSPGDLGDERAGCARVVKRLEGEFARVARLQTLLWEHEPLTAEAGFQEQILLPAECDVVVLMLWSRLGSRLPPRFRRADEVEAPTGTIFEFRNALDARRASLTGQPDILVYRKTAEPPKARITDQVAYLQTLAQWHEVEEFFRSRYFQGDGMEAGFVGAFHLFGRTAEFEELLEVHLRKLLRKRLGELPPGPANLAPSWTGGSPFRGLQPFDFEHAPVYAGRGRAATEVRDALKERVALGQPAFVLILGMSGSGKSSLARAGVLPDLVRPGVAEGVSLWRRLVWRPGEAAGGSVLPGLVEALTSDEGGAGVGLPELASGGAPVAPEELARKVSAALLAAAEAEEEEGRARLRKRRAERQAAGDERAVAELDELLSGATPREGRLALVVDQMEELFTDPRVDAAEREAFLSALDALARSGSVWVVATLRSDFFARCEAHPALVALKAGNGTYHLLPPGEAEISQMIRQPALAAGLSFEENPGSGERLDDTLLAAALKAPGTLPLLEFCLEELYRDRAPGGMLTHAAYRALGGVEGALASRAEAVFTGLPPAAQEAFGPVMRRLTTVNFEGEETFSRRWADHADLVRSEGARALVEAFLAPEARLLVADEGNGGAAVVSPTHESLFTHWPRLREWLRANREFLRVRARVHAAAALWREQGNDPGYLLAEGAPLAAARGLLLGHGADLDRDEREFIERSVIRAGAAAKRRLRGLQIAVSVFALLAVGAAFGAWFGFAGQRRATAALGSEVQARERAERARADSEIHREAAVVLNLLTKSPGPALALAIETTVTASRLGEPSNLVQYSLTSAFDGARESFHWLWEKGPATALALSPDGRWVALGGDGGLVALFDLRNVQPGPFIAAHGQRVTALAFSPDGSRLASASQDQTVRLWDLSGHPASEPFKGHRGWVNCVAFAPDGQTLWTGGGDATIRRWHLDGSLIGEPLAGHAGPVGCLAISPDGRQVVSADYATFDPSLRHWDGEGRPLGEFPHVHEGPVLGVAFRSDGLAIATAGQDHSVRLWNAAGQPAGQTMLGHETPVRAVAFSPDGASLTSTSLDGEIRAWNAAGVPLSTLKRSPGARSTGAFVAFTPDGEALVNLDGYGFGAWDLRGLRVRPDLKTGQLGIWSVALTRGWKDETALRLMTGGEDGTVRFLDRRGEDARPRLRAHSHGVTSLVADGDGTHFATASVFESVAHLWSRATLPTTGEVASVAEVPGAYLLALAPDGRTLCAAMADGDLRFFDLFTGQRLAGNPSIPVGTGRVENLAFSPDGRNIGAAGSSKIAAGGRAGASVWNVAEGKRLWDSPGEEQHRKLAFSPDGRWFATGTNSGVVHLWEASTFAHVGSPMEAHADRVQCLAFSPDSQRLISGSRDRTLGVWNLRGERLSPSILAHQGGINALAFTPDGRVIVSAGDDDRIGFRAAEWQGWLSLASRRLRGTPAYLAPANDAARQTRSLLDETLRDHPVPAF